MKALSIIALFLFSIGQLAAKEADNWFSLGEEVEFDNDLSMYYCSRLTVNSDFIAWVIDLRIIDDHLIFNTCEAQNKKDLETAIESKYKNNKKRQVSGWVTDDWFYITQDNIIPTKVDFPKFGYFSIPFVCGYVAYWGTDKTHEKNDWYAMVIDFKSGNLIKEAKLGHFGLETDYRWILKEPIWDDSCSSVTFLDSRYIEDKKISLKNNQTMN
ncbi:hypothetical protein FE810_12110 [Thalassotalea litorea]|uniref:Uncharacterized protein n=1 Tax=Thalassotalea litorea TaxID=2020715 RepID=A0A5R9IJS8_9GAMM|nr:hypothetical protein [Thalassotalea litorea]TLU64337.1 hypothetical protein FE810_12110 [Thalassotalea litorea]